MTSETPKQMSTVAVSTPAATRTILIVDDDPSVTETFERMLRLEGYHVVTALSAEAGLNQADARIRTPSSSTCACRSSMDCNSFDAALERRPLEDAGRHRHRRLLPRRCRVARAARPRRRSALQAALARRSARARAQSPESLVPAVSR